MFFTSIPILPFLLLLTSQLFLTVRGLDLWESEFGYYAYIGAYRTKGDPLGLSEVKALAELEYLDMKAVHSKWPEYPEPKMVAAMAVDGVLWLSSGGAGGRFQGKFPADFPNELKTELDNCYGPVGHGRNGKCAEIMLLAFYMRETGTNRIPSNAPMAVYGYGSVSGQTGFHQPCWDSPTGGGCFRLIENTHHFNIGKRSILNRRAVKAAEKPALPAKEKTAKGKPTMGNGGRQCLEPIRPKKGKVIKSFPCMRGSSGSGHSPPKNASNSPSKSSASKSGHPPSRSSASKQRRAVLGVSLPSEALTRRTSNFEYDDIFARRIGLSEESPLTARDIIGSLHLYGH